MRRKKVKVEIFVPLGSCICNFAPLMEKVGQATLKYKDSVDVQVKSTKSSETSEHEVQDMSVVVNGKYKFSPDFDEKEFDDAILKEV